MKKLLTWLLCAMCISGKAANDVKVTLDGMTATMSNGPITINIGSNGRIGSMTYSNGPNILGSNGIYFDYTATENSGLNPTTAKIIKQTPDYAEVLYSNTNGDIQFEQGFIMRKGVNGVYVYIIANGTPTSESVAIREARVCTRLNSGFRKGYVDELMQGEIPSNTEMAEAEKEENVIQDATYRMADGSIYTKYNWAQYIVNDSLHGLMNNTTGVWNIPCSYEWINGGPMRQELTVHATSKSPITLQMIQGEHFGSSAQTFKNGKRKLYGPFLIYVNRGLKDNMIADAKKMAQEQISEWPFEWFDNQLYPLDRAVVKGRLNITNTPECDSVQVLLAEPGANPYTQGKSYMFWSETDAQGNFTIKNVRKGNYALYAWATKGGITDEMEMGNISIDNNEVNLGNINWTPAIYENLLWQIGENNRRSDGFRYCDTLRNYGLWTLPPADLTYTVGESKPHKDWYYAQSKNGKWTISFNLDRTYTGNATLTFSMAGITNNPTLAISVNGNKIDTWQLRQNDAAIYRSALQGGRHSVRQLQFAASMLKKGSNTISLSMSGIGRNGGIMYDCIKLEAGKQQTSNIGTLHTDSNSAYEIYSLSGKKLGTFSSLSSIRLNKGIYIYRHAGKSGKIQF